LGCRQRHTHEVFNRAGALEGYNAYRNDEALVETVRSCGAAWAADKLGAPAHSLDPRGCSTSPARRIVVCLDMLRAIRHEPDTVGVLLAEVRLARGAGHGLDAFEEELARRLHRPDEFEATARRLVEMMALALQASLLLSHSVPAVADALCATRLAATADTPLVRCQKGLDARCIIDRARDR
jgi:hypothetical protein